MTDSGSLADPVGRLAEDFMARYRRGERPALAEYTDKYPDLADRIRDVFPMLVVMEEADSGSSSSEDATGSGPAGAPGRDRPERIAGYHILREIGRGGMGVVYEAEQLSLGRHVALKLLPEPIARDARGLERFRREAKAAARLHHTNIVPVHEVGQDGGVAFYAMQFIQGQPLDVVLDELKALRSPLHAPQGPAADVARSLQTGRYAVGVAAQPDGAPEATTTVTMPAGTTGGSSAVLPGQSEHSSTETGRRQYDRSVAQVGVQVAEALAYAHREGVIHRDIKPSNLLLDADSRVWITDFGLAKTDDDALTCTGDILGTLRYMAPERFRGWSDPRSDVYSLGLTLYEMLLLRPAFEAADRLELIRRVTHEEPARPRTLDPRIPRDLETIVLKAIDKEPSRRYPSADELAADLRRFLVGDPIKARSVGLLERAWIWARRRPLAAALLLVSGVAVLALGGVITGAVLNTELREANARARAALEEARFYQYYHHIARAQAGWSNGAMGGVETLLDACPPDQRRWEWDYLKRQCHTDLLTLQGLPGPVNSVAFSPDGTRIAAASIDGTVKVWDAATAQVILTLKTTDTCFRVAFSPDGTRLASGSHGRTVVWDLATRQEVRELTGHPDDIFFSLAFSPDGRRLASAGGDPRIWDATTSGDALFTLKGHTGPSQGIAYSPDGTRLASAGGDRTVRIWDATTEREALLTLAGHTDEVLGVAFSPDGKHLASSSFDRTVKVWDATTGQELHTLKGHTGGVAGVAYSPDGRWLASASVDQTVKLWDAASGREARTLKGHTHQVRGVAFSPDGTRLASAGWDRTVKVWDLTAGTEARTLPGHMKGVSGLAISPDGKYFASAGFDRTVKVWDATTGQELHALEGHTNRHVGGVAFSPDGKHLASANSDRTVKLWDAATGQELHALEGHTSYVGGVAYSPDGRWLASSSSDKTVKVWDATTGGDALFTLKGHTAGVLDVAFSPDGTRLASTGGDRTVRIWDVPTGRPLLRLEGQSELHIYKSVVFSRDGTLIASAEGDLAVIRDATTGQVIHTLKGHTDQVLSVAFSPDGMRLASASFDSTVKLWDARTGQEALSLRGHTQAVTSVAFSPDGTQLVTASVDGTVKVWDARPWTSDAALEREALGLLDFLFVARPLCRVDVLDYVRNSATLRPEARQLALSLVDRYREETDPEKYHQASWAIVRQPYLNPFQYRFALLQAEHARRLAPDEGRYRTALGAAQYRTGRYQDALATLTRADRLDESPPADLAFLAMAQHRLGQADEARATLGRLREFTSQPRWTEDIEARGLLDEAEALITTP